MIKWTLILAAAGAGAWFLWPAQAPPPGSDTLIAQGKMRYNRMKRQWQVLQSTPEGDQWVDARNMIGA